jgi:peptidoglycan/LPS O-acetylase OafA/YrhL
MAGAAGYAAPRARWRAMTVRAAAPANNFNLLRLLAAWLVMLSHSYDLAGARADEPLLRLTGGTMTLGTLAVGVFFAISGYLITASAYARADLRSFLAARARRIFPALIAITLLSALLLGPLMTTLDARGYFSAPAVAFYVLHNITLLHLQYDLPGVFTSNPYGAAVNGSLWTLPIEFALYLAVGAAVWTLRRLRLTDLAWLPAVALAVGCLAGWGLLLHGSAYAPALLVPYFLVGAALRIYRRRMPLHGAIAAALLLALALCVLWHSAAFTVCACLAISYTTLWIARHPRWIAPFDGSRLGDLSYGIYLLAFPLQQTVLALGWTGAPWPLFAWASLLTWPCAWLTWHLIERHFVAPPRPGLADGALPELPA